MNKVFKKVLVIGLIFVMALCNAGCDKEDKGQESQTGQSEGEAAGEYVFFKEGIEDVRYAERYQIVSLTEGGILYDGDDELIHLVTIDEMEDIILCYDPNCEHMPASQINPDPSCRAALFYDRVGIAYYEGKIYYFVNDGVFDHKLYAMEISGAGRELIAELPFSFNVGKGVIFSGDMMYYTAMIPYEDEVTNTLTYTSRLVEYNLLDNTHRFITAETSDSITLMHLAGNYMYMRMADNDNNGQLYLVRTDIRTMEEEVLIPGNVYTEEYRYIRAYDEDSYFYYDVKNYEIGIRSVDEVHKKVLLKGAEGEDFGGWSTPSCNGMYYIRRFDYGDEKAGCYYMDLLTGEVADITEEQAKYSIVAYDAFYDVFITRDADFNFGMLTREKVLSEAME